MVEFHSFIYRSRCIAIVVSCAVMWWPAPAAADEGGVSFWTPGLFGSLAATPVQPGFNFASVYYHTSVEASGALAAAKQVDTGRLQGTARADLSVNLDARADVLFLVPGYTFETLVFGGQLGVNMAVPVGRQATSLNGVLSESLGPLVVTREGSISDSASGFLDLYPQATLKWNSGVHNYMIYGMTNIQAGSYDSKRLSNLGLGHGAIDGGLGYTYFDPAKGHEFSVVAGLTHNFENKHTDYTNGLDFHADLAASQFLSKQVFVGAVGYVYQQLTPDKGGAAFLGSNESRVFGAGPQVGYIFEAAPTVQGLLNLKGYYEFESYRRPEGWNVWATLAFSPAEKAKQVASSRMPLK